MPLTDNEREYIYLILSAMFVIFPTGYLLWSIFGMGDFGIVAGMSGIFITAGFLIFLRTVLTIKITELELHIKPVDEKTE